MKKSLISCIVLSVIFLCLCVNVYLKRAICRHCQKMKKMDSSTSYSLEVFKNCSKDINRVDLNHCWGQPDREEEGRDVHVLPDGSEIQVMWNEDKLTKVVHNQINVIFNGK